MGFLMFASGGLLLAFAGVGALARRLQDNTQRRAASRGRKAADISSAHAIGSNITDSSGSLRCGGCNSALVAKFADSPRIPCPSCGSTLRQFIVVAEAGSYVTVGGSLEFGLIPGNQVRDWKARWERIQAEAAELASPRSGGMTTEAIQAERHRLHSFYIQCYHLKDALTAEQPNGLTRDVVEKAVTNSPDIALVADLCNQDKHTKVTHAPRSGAWPVVSKVSGRTIPGGWRLSLEVSHKGGIRDGIDIAEAAVSAWEGTLKVFGLI